MIPLNQAKEGASVTVVRIEAGQGVMARLNNMGIMPGEQVRLIRNSYGQIIIAKDNARFALGRGMAHKIFVEVEEEE